MASHDDTHEFIVVEDPATQLLDRLPKLDSDGIPSNPTFSPINGRAGSATSSSSQTRRKSIGARYGGDSLEQLRALPELRPIPWYEGRELPEDKSIGSNRVQSRGACLLASRGEVMDPPCKQCAAAVGRFSLCIASPDWFKGACATCQMATRGNLCSYRKPDTLRPKRERKSRGDKPDSLHCLSRSESPWRIATSQPDSTTAQAPIYNGPQPKRPSPEHGGNDSPQLESLTSRVTTREASVISPTSELQATKPEIHTSTVEDPNSSRKKRKREPLDGQQEFHQESGQSPNSQKPYVSPYLPTIPLPSISMEKTFPSNPTVHYPPQPSPMSIAHVIQRKPLPSATPQSKSATRFRPIAAALVPQAMVLQSNTPHTPIPQYENPPYPAQIGSANANTFLRSPDTSSDSDVTESITPNVQPVYTHECPQKNLVDRPDDPSCIAGRGSNFHPVNPGTTKTPSRVQQEEVYAIIEDLQKGITSCQKQTSDMQRQLCMLRSALSTNFGKKEEESSGG